MPERDSVDELLRKSAHAEIPADVEARMRRQFVEFRGRLGEGREPAPGWTAWLGRRPFGWAASAAAVAIVLALPFVWGGVGAGRVYAAAVSRLAAARSVQYTMEVAPFVTVEFSHLAPARERFLTSWGIEVRADGTGAQLVLLHGSKQYVREQKGSDGVLRSADLIDQLMALPEKADSVLAERTAAGKRFTGYRVMGTRIPGQHGVEWLDLWLDAESGALDHVDVTPTGAGASGYQMHIRDIRLDAEVDPALFELTPPRDYVDARTAGRLGGKAGEGTSAEPRVAPAAAQAAIVIPMQGPFEQASAAVDRVAQHLQQRGVAPTGPAFGRFESESRWEVGYPVLPGASAEAPFQVITVPAGLVASVTVNGPWGNQSATRWSRLLSWLDEHGYVIVGPPTEAWTGDAAEPSAQVTEMRVAVTRAPR